MERGVIFFLLSRSVAPSRMSWDFTEENYETKLQKMESHLSKLSDKNENYIQFKKLANKLRQWFQNVSARKTERYFGLMQIHGDVRRGELTKEELSELVSLAEELGFNVT